MTTKEDDFIGKVIVASTHTDLLFFSNKGRVYKIRAYEVPDAGRTAKGTNVINLIPLDPEEVIQDVLSIKNMDEEGFLIMSTKQGIIKKTKLSEYKYIRKNGLNAINLREDDELLKVKVTRGDAEIMVITKDGYAIRFSETNVRPMGRTASGVKAITLREGDIAVSMDIVVPDERLLIISEEGFGKRTNLEEYPIQNRGGKGIKTYKVTEKTGTVADAKICKDGDELMLINSDGIAIRINVDDVSISSRSTSGVRLMRTNDNQKIVAVAKISSEEDENQGEESQEIIENTKESDLNIEE